MSNLKDFEQSVSSTTARRIRLAMRVLDFALVLFALAFFFVEGFSTFFFSLPYPVKALFYLLVVFFFAYSIRGWYLTVVGSMRRVVEEDERTNNSNTNACDFVAEVVEEVDSKGTTLEGKEVE